MHSSLADLVASWAGADLTFRRILPGVRGALWAAAPIS